MTLLVDVGNSAVKWAWLDRTGGLARAGRLLHRDRVDFATELATAWSGAGSGTVMACSVADAAVVGAVEQAARRAGLLAVHWLKAQAESGGPAALINGYADWAQLGADRWHALVGARSRWPGDPLVVVNAGTATTVDCIRTTPEPARFIGGCIAPGVQLMIESLARGTAGLPMATGEPSEFPLDTDSAIVTGVLDAQAGLVERVVRRFMATLDRAPRVVMAGGHAERLAGRLPAEFAPTIDHNLVLLGLAVRSSTR